jgi:hypothetical protein
MVKSKDESRKKTTTSTYAEELVKPCRAGK